MNGFYYLDISINCFLVQKFYILICYTLSYYIWYNICVFWLFLNLRITYFNLFTLNPWPHWHTNWLYQYIFTLDTAPLEQLFIVYLFINISFKFLAVLPTSFMYWSKLSVSFWLVIDASLYPAISQFSNAWNQLT